MLVPVQITFRNTEPSEAVSADINRRIDKLSRLQGNIISCRVVVEAPLPNQRKGGLYRVRIELGCPEGQVIVNREPDSRNQAHQDVYLAVRDAFRAAERQLEEHPPPPGRGQDARHPGTGPCHHVCARRGPVLNSAGQA